MANYNSQYSGAQVDTAVGKALLFPTPSSGDVGKVPTVNQNGDAYSLETPSSGGAVLYLHRLTISQFVFLEVVNTSSEEITPATLNLHRAVDVRFRDTTNEGTDCTRMLTFYRASNNIYYLTYWFNPISAGNVVSLNSFTDTVIQL